MTDTREESQWAPAGGLGSVMLRRDRSNSMPR